MSLEVKIHMHSIEGIGITAMMYEMEDERHAHEFIQRLFRQGYITQGDRFFPMSQVIFIEIVDLTKREEVKPPQDYWTIKQVAKEFGYSISWTMIMCRRGIIKALKPYGGAWRIPASEVQRIREKHLLTKGG